MSKLELTAWVALAGFVGTLIVGVLTFIVNRRSSDDSRALGLINAGQVSLEAALDQANEDIQVLRGQVREMRAELNEALHHHDECERDRKALLAEIAEMRRRTGEQ